MSSHAPQAPQSSAPQGTPPPQGRPQGGPQGAPTGPAVARQFVNFHFLRLDPAFRQLPNDEKEAARAEFIELFRNPTKGMLCLSYSTAGLKADCDVLLWRISMSPDDFQAQTGAINKT